MQVIFKTISLTGADWLRILPLALIPFAAAEITKWVYSLQRARKD